MTNGNLQEALLQLAEAQRRTEERLEALAGRVEQLAVQVDQLERALETMVEVQRETTRQVAELTAAQRELTRQVGALGDNIGLWVEDIARVVLPGYLERHFGVKLRGRLGEELGRRFLAGPSGEIEINLYGEGEQDGEQVEILGEVKNRLYRRDVERFDRVLKILEPGRLQKAKKVMFAFWIHPSASEAAAEKGILLVASYQR